MGGSAQSPNDQTFAGYDDVAFRVENTQNADICLESISRHTESKSHTQGCYSLDYSAIRAS